MADPKVASSADALRADNDPTTDPYHSRGVDPAVAQAGFEAAGYGKGPLAGKKASVLPDVAVAPDSGLPNPTADSADVPPGGIVREGQIVDPLAKDQSAADTKPTV